MRTAAILTAVLVLTATAAAEPDYLGQINRWLWPNKATSVGTGPKLEQSPDVVHEPAAAPRTVVPEATVSQTATSHPETVPRKKKVRPVDSRRTPTISCSDARQGVGMPCFLIRQHAWRYEQLSPAQKREADLCLTAAERAAIRACFR